jgi:hypothetical protein
MHDKFAFNKGKLVVLRGLSNDVRGHGLWSRVKFIWGHDTYLVIILSNGSKALLTRCGSGGYCLGL